MKSLKTQIMLFFCIILILASSSIGYMGYSKATEGMENLQQTLLMDKLRSDMKGFHHLVTEYHGQLRYVDGDFIDNRDNSVTNNFYMVDSILEDQQNLGTVFVKDGDDFRRISTNIMNENGERAVGTMLGHDSAAYELVKAGRGYVGHAEILGDPYLTIYDPIIDKDGEVVGILFIGLCQEQSQNLIIYYLDQVRKSALLTGSIIIIIGIMATYLIGKSIADPINHISQCINRLSNYDLSLGCQEQILKYKDKKDEVGLMAKSLEVLHNNFIDIITNVTESSSQLASSSEQLTLTSEESSIAAEEIAKVIQEIAQGASDQAMNTEDATLKTNEIGAAIETNARYVEALNGFIDEIDKQKDEGFVAIDELVKNTEISDKSTQNIFDVIIRTNENAGKIESASDMIASIAEQTNLLALNAAIEAARAGEAGRGFSVVADEIRKLAEESNTFTQEIRTIIDELKDKTSEAVKIMDVVKVNMEEQNLSVTGTRQKFGMIAQAIENTKGSIEGLTSSEKEIADRKDELMDLIQNLAAIAQENAAGTQESAAGIEEQAAGMQEIAGSTRALSKLAEELTKVVGRFQI